LAAEGLNSGCPDEGSSRFLGQRLRVQ
jgi:hypothetical protein